MQEEAAKRMAELESINKQRLRDKNVLNKDLIDFTHPSNFA